MRVRLQCITKEGSKNCFKKRFQYFEQKKAEDCIFWIGFNLFASLDWLYTKGSENWDLLAVVSQPDRKQGRGQKLKANPVAKYAKERGIQLLQPEKPAEDLAQFLEKHQVDISFVMAYGHFLGRAIREASRLGMVNFHGSILPKFRGASPVETAIACGELRTGVSLMQIDCKMDAGKVGDMEVVSIEKEDDILSVRMKIGEATIPILERSMEDILNNNLVFKKQDEEFISHCRKLKKKMD